jgi:signal transduction histidine kinase
VIRELLLNVAKHAGTDRAQVDIRSSGDDLHLIVTDNGKGFDTMRVLEKRNRSNGFGIFNVRQRIEHLNGILDLKSMPGAGSRATISVPLLNGQAEQ